MRNVVTLTGFLGLIITVVALVEAITFPLQDLENGLGAAFFPLLILFLLASLSVVAIVTGLLATGEQTAFELKGAGSRAALSLLLCLVLFTIAFSFFGLMVPAMCFVAAASYFLGAPLHHAVLTGVIAGAAVRVLFVNILNVYMI